MARVLNDDEQQKADQIQEHDLFVKLEKKHDLLFKAVEQNHKHGFFFRLFKRKCRICDVMKAIK